MKILVTNDGGIESPGVWALNKGLISITPLRFEVTDHKLIATLSLDYLSVA